MLQAGAVHAGAWLRAPFPPPQAGQGGTGAAPDPSPQALPMGVPPGTLILHEVNLTASTNSCSSARADDDEGVNNNNNIFYLYHTFKTEEVRLRHSHRRNNPTAAGAGSCDGDCSGWAAVPLTPAPCPAPPGRLSWGGTSLGSPPRVQAAHLHEKGACPTEQPCYCLLPGAKHKNAGLKT